jgi:RNA polymerase sigma factor (sigma-70 family)
MHTAAIDPSEYIRPGDADHDRRPGRSLRRAVESSRCMSAAERDRSIDEGRFRRAYEQHHHDIRSYCRRRVAAERVDDVVAETFLVAWRRRDDLPDDDLVLPWLYRVAYRVVGHEWRGRSRRQRLDEKLSGVPGPAGDSPEDVAIRSDEAARVLKAATRLKPQDAEILRLLSWEQLTRPEIAEILEISPNLVSKRIQRARKGLTREYNRLRTSDRNSTERTSQGGEP